MHTCWSITQTTILDVDKYKWAYLEDPMNDVVDGPL